MGRWRRSLFRATSVTSPPAWRGGLPRWSSRRRALLQRGRLGRPRPRAHHPRARALRRSSCFVDDGSPTPPSAIRRWPRPTSASIPVVLRTSPGGAFSAGFKYPPSRDGAVHADLQCPPEVPAPARPPRLRRRLRHPRAPPGTPLPAGRAAASQWLASSWPASSCRARLGLPRGPQLGGQEDRGPAPDTPYFIATVPRVGARYTTVPIVHRPRLRGPPSGRPPARRPRLELLFGFSLRRSAAYLPCSA